jgi:malate permease and related proteins
MHVFNITLQSVVALLAIGVLGFWIIKRHIIPQNILQFLAVLAIEIALPCIVFSNIITQFSPSSSMNWWHYPLYWMVFSGVLFVSSLIATGISAKTTRREFVISLFFQNGLFFPFIIITGIFGSTNPYVAVLFIFIALHPTLFFSTNHLFFKKNNQQTGRGPGEEEPRSRLRLGRIVNPVLISTILAAVVKLSGTDKYLPSFVLTVFQMLGGMSMPLIMLILGGSLYVDFQARGPIYFREVIKFVVIKNFLFPLIAILVLDFVRPSYPVALIVFLQSSAPPITAIPIQVQRHGGNASITNQFILASFVFSILSVPLMFNLFSRYFPMP